MCTVTKCIFLSVVHLLLKCITITGTKQTSETCVNNYSNYAPIFIKMFPSTTITRWIDNNHKNEKEDIWLEQLLSTL